MTRPSPQQTRQHAHKTSCLPGSPHACRGSAALSTLDDSRNIYHVVVAQRAVAKRHATALGTHLVATEVDQRVDAVVLQLWVLCVMPLSLSHHLVITLTQSRQPLSVHLLRIVQLLHHTPARTVAVARAHQRHEAVVLQQRVLRQRRLQHAARVEEQEDLVAAVDDRNRLDFWNVGMNGELCRVVRRLVNAHRAVVVDGERGTTLKEEEGRYSL